MLYWLAHKAHTIVLVRHYRFRGFAGATRCFTIPIAAGYRCVAGSRCANALIKEKTHE